MRKYPLLWILGAHIYVPLLVGIGLILFALGYAFPINPSMSWGEYSDKFYTVQFLTVSISIAIAILFVIRQVKFNSKRIHHTLPYKFGPAFFFVFLVVFTGISAIPFLAGAGAAVRVNHEITERGIEPNSDSYLYDLEKVGIGDRYTEGLESKIIRSRWPFIFWDFEFWQAYIFVSVILSLLLYILCVTEIRDFGWAMLAAALIPTIFAIVFGLIISTMDPDESDMAKLVMVLLLLVSALIAFGNVTARVRLKRALAICIQLYLPVIVIILMLDTSFDRSSNDEEYFMAAALLTMLISVFLFNPYYKKVYIDPT
ncbi:hypothetical protein GYB22_09360 [bacterium]|nr:hypothetical protein [bacterium]